MTIKTEQKYVHTIKLYNYIGTISTSDNVKLLQDVNKHYKFNKSIPSV